MIGEVKVYDMPMNEQVATRKEGEEYCVALALFDLAQAQGIDRMLPSPFQILWKDWESTKVGPLSFSLFHYFYLFRGRFKVAFKIAKKTFHSDSF